MNFWSYYRLPVLVTVLGLIASYFIGGLPDLWKTLVLTTVGISLSFDNAVVNSSVIKNWDHKWRSVFLMIGLPVAVIGMRFVFPMGIVSFATGIDPISAAKLAINNPEAYRKALLSAHTQISAFGGAFLLMVALKFFFDENKEHHWIEWLEKPMQKFSQLEVAITASSVVLATSIYISDVNHQLGFLKAGLLGLAVFSISRFIGHAVQNDDKKGPGVVSASIGGFFYLELQDASFSFDDTIAAFALTNNLLIIAIGLGIGAAYVRGMTIQLVEANALSEFRYLEHGAYWAVGALAIIMLLSVVVTVPSWITGIIGVGSILLALRSSIQANNLDRARRNLKALAEDDRLFSEFP